MKRKNAIILVLAGMLLAACGESGTLSSSSPSSQETTTSISSEHLPTVYTIGFYDGETLLFTQEVKEGEAIERPEENPSKEGYDFIDWYRDALLTEPFEFGAPADKNISVFASFRLIHSFEDYNERIVPQYSPLSCEATFTEGDQDIIIPILATEVGINSALPVEAVHLYGAFKNLTVKDVTVEQNHLTIATQGTVEAGEGRVALSKRSNTADAYLTLAIPVSQRHAEIDGSTYRLAAENQLDFTIQLTNMLLAHEEGMTSDQYLEQVKAGQFPFFSVDSDRYSLEMIGIGGDFASFRFRLGLPGPLDKAIAEELYQDVGIHVAKEAFDSGTDQVFHPNLLFYTTDTKLNLYYEAGTHYKGQFEIKLINCCVTDAFKNHIPALLAEPNNKNAIFTFPGVETTLTALEVPDVTLIKGEFIVSSDFLSKGMATLMLSNLHVEGEEDAFFAAKTWQDPKDIALVPQVIPYDISFETSAPGTIKQTASTSYGTVKNTLNWVSSEKEESELMKIVSTATNLGKLGYGLYTGDFTSAKNVVGEMLGIDSLLSPTNQILKAIQGVMDKLNEIEYRIDGLVQQMQVLQAELEQLGQLSLYNNFMSANSGWNGFLTSYFLPLKNEMNSYSTDYFRYYYDLAVASLPGSDIPMPSVTLYYDNNGQLAFPGDNTAISIDGRTIDKSATRVVSFPELVHALAGIRANSGHSYVGIEDDIIVDLVAHDGIGEELLGDVLLKLRFDAMKSHFSDAAKIQSFCNVFANFCEALTADQIGGSGGFSPLDYYTTMLETACNFGFETEADINLCIIKLQASFFNAKSILHFVSSINPGDIQTSRYDRLCEAVNQEFASTRFFHSNRPDLDGQGHGGTCIYSYAAGSYVLYTRHRYTLEVNNAEQVEITRNGQGIDSFTSIDEATARLMMVKVKAYNRIHNTNYTFKQYLVALGMIPEDKMDETWGICVGLEGLIEGGEAQNLTYYKEKMDFAELDKNTGHIYFNENVDPYNVDRDWDKRFAIKGTVVSLDDDRTFHGLLAAYLRTEDVDWIDNEDPIVKIDYVGLKESENIMWEWTVGAFYCTFEPIAA
ncbi:MAG: InlB B-repeat-containing protein [Bacilli bacterium]|nr:InlB B-repeat-containing protein [Bacilli bacterium]